MNKSIYISIFGLNLSTINDLKNIIYSHFFNQYQIQWTHITDTRLQLLLINDDFADIDHVEKISKSNIQILKLKKNHDYSGELIDETLYLPVKSPETLYDWIEQALDKVNMTVIAQTASTLGFENEQRVPKKISHQALANAFHKVHEEYAGIRHFVLENNQNIMACFDLKNKEFYQNPEFNFIAEGHFDIVPANLNTVVQFKKYFQRKELSHGIWQFIWDHAPDHVPNYGNAYKLKHWPQPSLLKQRTELLKISAYLSKGCTVAYIHEKTNISVHTIHRYLYACDIAQMMEEISVTESLDAVAVSVEIQEVSKVRSFFSSLRAKLGL